MTVAILHDPALEAALADAALSALDRALGSPGPSVAPKSLERLFPIPSASARRGRRRAERAASRLAPKDTGGLSRFQARILSDALAPGEWGERWRRLFDRMLRRRPEPPAILDPARRALAASVWSAPPFRRAVSLRLYRSLRHEVLMTPEPFEFPGLSSDFWWVLIAAFSDSTPLGKALKAAGSESGAAKGWAGFWEQYLLLRAQRAGGNLPGGMDQLPLVGREVRALHPASDDPDDPVAARPGWRDARPGWAVSLIDGAI